ncbi:MAG TPA: peptide deformylase [Solirubrobacteraceae bacterium]|nr:peptide deformylase [Solirubrobacteraceae bacterium]
MAERDSANREHEEIDETRVEELDAEARARRDAALARVRKLGDPVLRAKALPVERFDEALRQETERMGELMTDALGIGLAATQVGVMHRVLVYRAFAEDPITALVNPELEWVSEDLETGSEGCLSLPGVHVEVERPAKVRVHAKDPDGRDVEIDAEGLEARVIQHEIDHLDGILILDRISREARREAMRALREARESRPDQPRPIERQPAERPSAEVQSAERPSAEVQSAERPSAEVQSAERQSAEVQPAERQPA